jgi:hypothetical protein
MFVVWLLLVISGMDCSGFGPRCFGPELIDLVGHFSRFLQQNVGNYCAVAE